MSQPTVLRLPTVADNAHVLWRDDMAMSERCCCRLHAIPRGRRGREQATNGQQVRLDRPHNHALQDMDQSLATACRPRRARDAFMIPIQKARWFMHVSAVARRS